MITKEELYNIPVPFSTESYSPVSHRNVIEHIYEQLDKHNLTIKDENFITGRYGQQLIGYMNIEHSNSELGLRLAFRNSYDKSMSVAFVAGSNVWICGNGMISGEFNFLRKHTGMVNKELDGKIITTINQLENHFNLMMRHSTTMKNIEVDSRISAELVGRMFIEDEIINSQQLNIIKKEIKESTFENFRNNSLWSLYNHITYSLKESHPLTYINQHRNLHSFVEKEFNLQ
jgi:hypothetical protein